MLDTQTKARIRRKRATSLGWMPMIQGLAIGFLVSGTLGYFVFTRISRSPASRPPKPPVAQAASDAGPGRRSGPPREAIQPSPPRQAVAPVLQPSRKDTPHEHAPLLVTSQPLAIDRPDAIAAIETLKNYRSARSIEEKTPFIHAADRTLPLMQKYYEVRQAADPVPNLLLGAATIHIGDDPIVHLTYSCSDRPNGLSVNFHRDPAGRLWLDWESFVGYSEGSWSDFKTRRPAEARLFRAHATIDRYYNFEFDEPGRFLSVKLRSPDGNEFVNGYCELDSGLGIFLRSLLTGPDGAPTEVPVTVLLAFPPLAKSDHCVWLRRLIASRWILLEGDLPADP